MLISRKPCETERFWQKNKNAFISKTVLDLDKFFEPQDNSAEQLTQFQKKKNFPPKMAAILNFSQKLQSTKMLHFHDFLPTQSFCDTLFLRCI